MKHKRRTPGVVLGATIACALLQPGCATKHFGVQAPEKTALQPQPSGAAQAPPRILSGECESARQAIDKALAAKKPVLMHDTLVLADCDNRSPVLARVRDLVTRGELVEGVLDADLLREVLEGRTPSLEAGTLTPGCEGEDCVVDAYFPKGAPVAKAPGGGVWSLIVCHSFVDGHSDISRKGLHKKLSSDAVELVADAAQDPDFYFWNAPWAHAQTHSDDKTGELVDLEKAQPCFLRWERATVERMLAACGAGEPRPALYWLGYALHGVQDLVFHEGISNAEHSYRDGVESEGIDCKEPPFSKKRDLAVYATTRFGDEVKRRYPACWAAMKAWYAKPEESAAYTRGSKVALIGHDWDLNPFPYKKLAGVVAARLAADPSYRERTMLQRPGQLWLRGLQREALDGWLAKPELWPAAVSGAGPLTSLDCREP